MNGDTAGKRVAPLQGTPGKTTPTWMEASVKMTGTSPAGMKGWEEAGRCVCKCGCHCVGTRGHGNVMERPEMSPFRHQGAMGRGAGVETCSVEPLPHCQVTLGVALCHLCHGQVTFVSGVNAVSAAWTTGSYHISYSCHVKAAVFS